VLLTAHSLSPDPRGFGTHTQLGLPACPFERLTHLPCPTCGLTTCFVLLSHGAIRSGVMCHPVGAVCFALLCAGLLLSAPCAWHGAHFTQTWSRLHISHVCGALVCALWLQWFIRTSILLLRRG